ncbi:MAG: hypothetical protein ACRC1H_02635, partial [Caldilineaceae bacterium]
MNRVLVRRTPRTPASAAVPAPAAASPTGTVSSGATPAGSRRRLSAAWVDTLLLAGLVALLVAAWAASTRPVLVTVDGFSEVVH